MSFDVGKNYFKGAGTINLLERGGEIKGNIYISPLNNYFSLYWKGNLEEGKGEIIPRDIRLKGKITFSGKGDISGNLLFPLFRGSLNLGVIGKNWKWKVSGKGENLENYLKLVEFDIYDDFSFKGNLLLNIYEDLINLGVSGIYKDGRIIGDLKTGDFNGKVVYDFKNLLEIRELHYSKVRLGDIILDISSQGLDLRGDILGGRVFGKVLFNRGEINFQGVNIKSIFGDLEGRVNGEILIEDYPKFKLVSDGIIYRNIKFRNISLSGRFEKGLYIDSFSLFLFEGFEVKGSTFIHEKNNRFEIKGNILGNEVLGVFEKNILKLFGDKFILKDPKILFEKWNMDFDNEKAKFSFSSPYFEYQEIPIKNLNFDFGYKDSGLNIKGKSYGINWEIKGILKNDFVFDLQVDSSEDFKLLSQYSYLIKSKWMGSLKFKDNIYLSLNLLKIEIPKVVGGKIEGNFSEETWNLFGYFDFINNGNLKIFLDSYRNGKIEGKFLPLDILKDLNIIDVSGDISLDLNFKEFSLENGNLGINLKLPLFKDKIESNLKILKTSGYKINGDIINLSKNKGLIDGVFKSGNLDINIFLPDSEFLYSFVSREFIKDLEKGKVTINILSDLREFNSEGNITFSNPISIPYVFDRVNSADFKLKYKENKILIESLKIQAEGAKISGSGEIFPELNLNLVLNKIILNIPNFLKGYSDWKIHIKSIKEPLIEGEILIYNSLISYPQEEMMTLPKIGLDLNINLGDNVYFYLPNTLNLSLRGKIKVLGDLSKPLLTGKIDFKKGNIQVLNRNFLIDYGYIKFPGLSFEENIWEFSGFSIIQNYTVFLKAYGFMGQSSIYLTSIPPLSLREILFLLLGQKELSLAKVETLPLYTLLEEIPISFQNLLGRVLTEYLLNPFLSEISRILGLESIKVQYILESFLPTWSKMTLEKKLGEDIIMKIDYSLEKGGFMNLGLEYISRSGLILKWLILPEGENLFSFEYKTKF